MPKKLVSKKLAFCLLRYFPYGGIQRDMMGVINIALEKGYLIDIYCLIWQGAKPDNKNIRVITIPVWAKTNAGRAMRFAQKLRYIFNHNYYYRKISFNRLPYTDVCFIGDHCFREHLDNKYPWFIQYLPRYRYFSQLEQGVFTSNSQVVLITQQQKNSYINYFPDKQQNMHLLAPWVQEKILSPEQAQVLRQQYRTQYQITDKQFLVLFMASQFKAKGLDRILLAISHLPNALRQQTRLIVAGAGKKSFYLQKIRAYQLADEVIYVGPCDHAQGLMCAADVFVHPARVELAGKVLLEAIINNLPVITTAVCGCAPYIAEAGNGIVIQEPYDQHNLDRALSTILATKQLAYYRAQAENYLAKTSFGEFPQQVFTIVEQAPALGSEQFYLADELSTDLPHGKIDCINAVAKLSGEVYRQVKNRVTRKIIINQQTYFLKNHGGIGWAEVLKNLCCFRLPVTSAKQEVKALRALKNLGITVPEIAAFAEQGVNPAAKHSFIITKAIDYQYTLEDLAKQWQTQAPNILTKRRLIKRVAEIAGTMHRHGINHRDFYICHFLLRVWQGDQPDLVLIDLHRAQIHKNGLPRRWLIKDLAGLYFSVLHINCLTVRDFYCFLQHYHQCKLDKIMQNHQKLWQKITIKAHNLYKKICN